MPKRVERRTVTVVRDDVARVDMSLDEDGDVEVLTRFRDGNRWVAIEAAPATLPPRAVLVGLIKLEVLGLSVQGLAAICEEVAGMALPPALEGLLRTMLGAARAAEDEGWSRG